MDTYYVVIIDRLTKNQRELKFQADDFGHAAEQAIPYVEADEKIVEVLLNYVEE